MSKRFIPPQKKGYTVYSISNCKYCKMSCDKIKFEKKIINCDDYILTSRDRDAFYKKIQKHTKIKYIHFPMIFKDAKFIGGYKELIF
jgi:glutaredoxin